MQLVHMKRDSSSGKLRPATVAEVNGGQTDGTMPLEEVVRQGLHTPDAGNGECGCRGHGFRDPGSAGPCSVLAGGGQLLAGLHYRNTGSSTADTSSPQKVDRCIRAGRLIAGGNDLDAWVLDALEVNKTPLKHGGLFPLTALGDDVRFPVEFDLDLCPEDSIVVHTASLLANGAIGASSDRLMLGAAACFEPAKGPSSPCKFPITKLNSRQIMLGLGTGSPTTAGAVTSISDTADKPVRLGRLILQAVFNGTSPDVVPKAGLTAGNGVEALEFIEIRGVLVNSVDIYASSNSATATAIPGRSCSAKAGGLAVPGVIVTPSDTITVQVVNRAPAHAGTGANTITVVAGFIGCEVLAA
jgi:hypothetical protein